MLLCSIQYLQRHRTEVTINRDWEMTRIAPGARKLQDLLSTSAADKVQSIDTSPVKVLWKRESSVFGAPMERTSYEQYQNNFQ